MKRPFPSSVFFASILLSGSLVAAAPPPAAAPKKDVLLIVEKALQKHGPDVHRCFEKALADRLSVAGKVQVEVVLGKGGKVTSARARKSERAIPPTLVACVEKVAQGFVLDGLEPGATVVLPFAFKPPAKQFVIKLADVPDRSQGAGAKRASRRAPPFTAKVIADENNVKVKSFSLALLTVGPASRVAMHRHPGSAKVLYLVKGHSRLLGPKGMAPLKLEVGSIAFIPAGFPHVIENMGRQSTGVFLQFFTPPGPERVYRDPKDPKGRAAFEVIRNAAQIALPAGSAITVVEADSVPATTLPGVAIEKKTLLDAKIPGTKGAEITHLAMENGAELTGKGGPKLEECYYLQTGAGELKVAGETLPVEEDSLFCIPVSSPFSFRASVKEKGQKVELLRFAQSLK